LVQELKKLSYEKKEKIWKRIAKELEKPTRRRREVNISRINRYTKENDIVIVPGKVLSCGEIDHKVTVIAWRFSKKAIEKLKKSGCDVIYLKDYIKKNPNKKNVKIIG